MRIVGYLNSLIAEVIRPSIVALVISLGTAALSFENAANSNNRTVGLSYKICSGTVAFICR
jgi:hypothetical protein